MNDAQVPLQYSDPSAGDAAIALVMIPSNYSHTDPSYLGPLLVNPGEQSRWILYANRRANIPDRRTGRIWGAVPPRDGPTSQHDCWPSVRPNRL